MSGSTPAAAAPRPMRRDAAANRERVLAAAEEVFADHGLAASVEEVARAAGVGMGTLYRRFPTKDDLVGELVRTVLNRFADLAEAALPAADGDGLESFLRSACALFGEHRGCLPRLWSGADERATIERARGSIASLLEAAQRHGKVRAEVTASDVTVALWALRGIVETTGGAEPAVCERHLEVLLAGLRPAPRPLATAPTDQRRLDELQAAGRRL